jgi:hypothetical protein
MLELPFALPSKKRVISVCWVKFDGKMENVHLPTQLTYNSHLDEGAKDENYTEICG